MIAEAIDPTPESLIGKLIDTRVEMSAEEITEISAHSRLLVLPGAGRNRYAFALLLDEEGEVLLRVPVLKQALRQLLLRSLVRNGSTLVESAAVTLEGDFPLHLKETRSSSP